MFGVSTALQRHPSSPPPSWNWATRSPATASWIHYQNVPEEVERAHMHEAWTSSSADRRFGCRPLGWYTGRDSPNTHRLVADYGGFAYDSDYYGDDLPFWMKVQRDGSVVPQLIVPYTLDCNDMRFALPRAIRTPTRSSVPERHV